MVCISLHLAEKPGPAWVRSVDMLQKTFVGLAFDVSTEGHPLLLVEQVGDEALELGAILDLVLGLAKHQAEQAVLLAKVLQDQAVLGFECRTVLAHPRAPVVDRRHGEVLIPGFLYDAVGFRAHGVAVSRGGISDGPWLGRGGDRLLPSMPGSRPAKSPRPMAHLCACCSKDRRWRAESP